MVFLFIEIPFSSRNRRVHNTRVMASSTATSSDSVELRVFNFCLRETEMTDPDLFWASTCGSESGDPNFIIAPVCERKSGWTAKDASIHHFIDFVLLAADSFSVSFG